MYHLFGSSELMIPPGPCDRTSATSLSLTASSRGLLGKNFYAKSTIDSIALHVIDNSSAG